MPGAPVGTALLAIRDFAAHSLPYCLTDDMLAALLAVGGPLPPQCELAELMESGKLRSVAQLFLGLEKAGVSAAGDPPGEIMLFLIATCADLADKSLKRTLIQDKIIVYGCHTIFKRWPKLSYLCSAISAQVRHENPDMRTAMQNYARRAGQQLMVSGAIVGCHLRLGLRFKRRLKKTSPVEQVKFLLHESPGDPEDRRQFLAMAWACYLLRDKQYLEKDGLKELLDCFKSDPALTAAFLDMHLSDVINCKARSAEMQPG